MPLSPDEFADQEDNELFRAIKRKDWGQVQSLVESSSELAQSTDKYGNTPLHAALGYKAPDSIVSELVSLHPDACRVHGSDDWLPLHVASMWGASTAISELIIRTYPEALDDRASGGLKGRTPRHFSARFPHNQALLERSTEEWKQFIQDSK